MPFEVMARHSMDFWLQAEDLPHPQNRVYYQDGKVHLDLVETNPQALIHLKRKLKEVLSRIGPQSRCCSSAHCISARISRSEARPIRPVPRASAADPATSVLDLDCKAHELDNLYLADASFFPSIGAVNPTLTIIANALRVADRIAERLK